MPWFDPHILPTVAGIIAVGALILGLIWLSGWIDRENIRRYLAARRGELLEATWSPFGPGWFGENRETIYFIRYLDQEENEHEAYCKTSLFSGVYFTQDRIVRYLKPPPKSLTALEAENERLRREIEMLRDKQGQG